MKILELDNKLVSTADKQYCVLSRNFELKDITGNKFFKTPFIRKTVYTTESNFAKLDNEIYGNLEHSNIFFKFLSFFICLIIV